MPNTRGGKPVVLKDRDQGLRKATRKRPTGVAAVDLFLTNLTQDACDEIAAMTKAGEWSALATKIAELDWTTPAGQAVIGELAQGDPIEQKLGQAVLNKDQQQIAKLLKGTFSANPVLANFLLGANSIHSIVADIRMCNTCCFRQACVALNNIMDALMQDATVVDCDQPRGRCFFRRLDDKWDGQFAWNPKSCPKSDSYLGGEKNPWAISVRCNEEPEFVADGLWFHQGLYAMKEGRYAQVGLSLETQQTIDGLETNVETLGDDVDALRADLDQARADVAALSARVAALEQRKHSMSGRFEGHPNANELTGIGLGDLDWAAVGAIRAAASGYQYNSGTGAMRPVTVAWAVNAGPVLNLTVADINGMAYGASPDWDAWDLYLTWSATA